MQACYVNTTHPDFLNGHKAMSIVTERMNANKPQPTHDPKKVTPAQLNNNRDLDVDTKEEPSFFGSFFAKNQPKKKGVAAMDAVSPFASECTIADIDFRLQPPPVIKPQAALNERETMETEVISASPSCSPCAHRATLKC